MSHESTNADLLARLESIQRGIKSGANAATAAKSPVGDLTSHTGDPDETESRSARLAAQFRDLARAVPGWAALGEKEAQDNPTAFLNRRDASGQFLVDDGTLGAMISMSLEMNAGKRGVRLRNWAGQHATLVEQRFASAIRGGHFDGPTASVLTRALDTGTGGALIRTDIDDMVRAAYLRSQPACDLFNPVPANGLMHTFDIETSPGTAKTVSELGDLTATNSDVTVVQSSTPIAIMASRRILSLKLQWASTASGMNFNLTGPRNRNVIGGLTAMANLEQSLILQGNRSVAGGTINTEDGAYDANGFTGLRQILKGASTSVNKQLTDSYLKTLNSTIASMGNAGADLQNLIIMRSLGAAVAIDAEFLQFTRVMNESKITDSARSAIGYIHVGNALARFAAIPSGAQGLGLGYYDVAGVATEDLYVVDPNGIEMPYLGSPYPTILELPMGFDNTLSTVYIMFCMKGMAVYIPGFQRKIRIPRQVV